MIAAVLKDFNVLVLEDVPVPEPAANEVVVRINACGVCATDYKAIKGIRTNVTFPFIAGHEASGVVAAVGAGVSHLSEGDEVICQPSGYCGVCRHCRAGNTHYCEKAFTTGGDGPQDVRPGAFAEYMKTDAMCLFRKPASISFRAATQLRRRTLKVCSKLVQSRMVQDGRWAAWVSWEDKTGSTSWANKRSRLPAKATIRRAKAYQVVAPSLVK